MNSNHLILTLHVALSLSLSLSLSATTDALRAAHSVLCPVSGIGTGFAVSKSVTLLGTGETDNLSLSLCVCGGDMAWSMLQELVWTCVYSTTATATISLLVMHPSSSTGYIQRHTPSLSLTPSLLLSPSLTPSPSLPPSLPPSLSVQVTGEYELLNYSDHGSVVDGVLYSCDFSDKTPAETSSDSPQQQLCSRGTPEKASEKLETARRRLRDQTLARRSLEGALNLCKHSGREEGVGEVGGGVGVGVSGGGATRRTTYNSSVVSIPLTLSRAKKLSAGVPAGSVGDKKEELSVANGGLSPEKMSAYPDTKTISLLCPDPPPSPCVCRRSASCLVGANRKGWEGTATLYHGSRLRFGCLQFVFSVAGKPGHVQLLDSLSPLLHIIPEHT